MTEDRIITRHISDRQAGQGAESEAPVFCNDGPQLAALRAMNGDPRKFCSGQTLGAAPQVPAPAPKVSGDLISREAAIAHIAASSEIASEDKWHAVHTIRSVPAALPAQGQTAAPAVKVKPLHWQERDEDRFWAAEGCGEMYYIRHYAGMKLPYRVDPSRLSYIGHPTLEAAKAAAQADYEARILSALEGAE